MGRRCLINAVSGCLSRISHSFSAELVNNSRWINYPRILNIKLYPDTDEIYEDRLELLNCDVVSKKFIILRNITATVGSRADQEELKALPPYTPRKRTRTSPPAWVVSAGRPPSWSKTMRKSFFGSFEAPKDLIEAAYGEDGQPTMPVQAFREVHASPIQPEKLRYRFKVSYLARLMGMPLYDLGEGDDATAPSPGSLRGLNVVKLIQNFRSHPAILDFPNRQFYQGEIQPCRDEVITRSLKRMEDLPQRDFPLIFHGIVGKDQREGDNPSFFNAEKATLMKKYCTDLTSRGRKNRVDPKDIGVITPYHKQRCKIGALLAKSQMKDIKIGSVEEFQGQERKVIIMSTVRSSAQNVESDIRSKLGFLANPRRFNVAITRARSLLIVIGYPLVLPVDPLWRSFLN